MMAREPVQGRVDGVTAGLLAGDSRQGEVATKWASGVEEPTGKPSSAWVRSQRGGNGGGCEWMRRKAASSAATASAGAGVSAGSAARG